MMTDIELEFMQDFGAGLDAAVEGRHLPNPILASSNPNETDSSAYIRAIRARLIELGYLGEGESRSNRTKEVLDAVLVKKIKLFQKEAGITEDGWAGEKTWQILECLVSFENQQSPTSWPVEWIETVKDLASNQAVMRGVYCRLYVMGFFADWTRDHINTKTQVSLETHQHFREAIDKFCQFAKDLELLQESCSGLSLEFLSALFEYDKIVMALGKPDIFSRVNEHYQINIDAIIRIELWLLGYDIVPGKDQTEWESVGSLKTTMIRKKVSKTQRAIERFYADNQQDNYKRAGNNIVSAELMAGFSELIEEPGKDIYVGKQLNDTVGKILADKSAKKELENQFQKLANGIFDGIKRVIRWLFRIVKKVVSFTKEFIANIVRYISKKARNFYVGVVKAFDIVFSGMTYLKRTAHHFSNPVKIVFSHDKDFDQFCLIQPGLSSALIRHDVAKYNFRSSLYTASLDILSHLMHITHRILRVVIQPFNWLLALLSLSDLANSVKAIKRQLDLVNQYQLDIESEQRLFSSHIS